MPTTAKKPSKINEKKLTEVTELEQALAVCNQALLHISRIANSPLPPHKIKKYKQELAARSLEQFNAANELQTALQKLTKAELAEFNRRINM